MTVADAVFFAMDNLRKNPVRTLLTILGLGVGIGAILTVLTLGSAGQARVEKEIARLGVNKVWITAEGDSGAALDAYSAQAITAATGAPACAGAYTMGGVRLGNRVLLARISGYDAAMESVHQPILKQGRMLTAREYAQGAAVGLMDEGLAQTLEGDVLEKWVDVGARRIKIVGIVEAMKGQAAAAANGTIIIPLQTFLDTYAAQVGEITVDVPGGARAGDIGEKAVAALSASGGEFRATSLENEIDAALQVVRIFVMVLACVAAVCMLTGGIGVMNILLVSVRERRQEIGLMKAVGGTSGQVGALFLLESVGYALLGGVLGILLGMGMIALFGAWIGLQASLSARLALPAVGIAGVLGVVFGVTPAMRAAAMAPVDALRRE